MGFFATKMLKITVFLTYIDTWTMKLSRLVESFESCTYTRDGFCFEIWLVLVRFDSQLSFSNTGKITFEIMNQIWLDRTKSQSRSQLSMDGRRLFFYSATILDVSQNRLCCMQHMVHGSKKCFWKEGCKNHSKRSIFSHSMCKMRIIVEKKIFKYSKISRDNKSNH